MMFVAFFFWFVLLAFHIDGFRVLTVLFPGAMIWSVADLAWFSWKTNLKPLSKTQKVLSLVLSAVLAFSIHQIITYKLFVPALPDKALETKTEMEFIGYELDGYHVKFGRYPLDYKIFRELIEERGDWQFDAWKNSYEYESSDASNFRLTSKGGDGELGAADDIILSGNAEDRNRG